ncbi:penicillin acylase family protein [uncultured Desulfobacter sp.]|uniref:penicillin acylase family protein n=1 Tax=uncultured Desulfobacter sp. TaxID=240139 RepID=UPI0029F4C897|nr:penicillin acylase family protein [uncultured Desulfobacter sp.]
MKWILRVCVVVALLVVCCVILFFFLPHLNDYQDDGQLNFAGLSHPVTVTRDDSGIAYIHAENIGDLFFAQGFVTAQDRLFQMQMTRMYYEGRLSELAGAKAIDLDVRMHTIGISRMAKKQARILNPALRKQFQHYVDGINAFIKKCPGDLALEFRLAGVKPDLWQVKDCLGVLFYLGYSTAANLTTEIVSQMLLDTLGYEKTAMLLPLNINLDDPDDNGFIAMPPKENLGLALPFDPDLMAYAGDRALRVGSNNWAVAPEKSATGSALLAGDPHLDPRMLPGVWYPAGLICPGIRAVGAQIPGIPGMGVGRTGHIALSATNNYGDMVDLYIETVDPKNPDHYLEGGKSIAFGHIKERLQIKDKDAPGGFRTEPLDILTTRRGPVVSKVLKGLDGNKVFTLRFAPVESMTPDIGVLDILTAKNVEDLSLAMQDLPVACFNWVFADSSGNIGHQASGRIPVRRAGGTFPHVVKDAADNWQGWIVPDQMPGQINPEKKWVGTCNNKTVDSGFPYYYSSFFAPSFRYARLKELMAGKAEQTPLDMWRYQRDTGNIMARCIAPIMARIFLANGDTKDFGRILADWDFKDDPEKAGPLVFQAIYRHFALAVFEDDLGPQKVLTLLNAWYYWQERLLQFVQAGESLFFDDIRTAGKTETMADLFIRAAHAARKELSQSLGDNPAQWRWGDLHTLELINPLFRKGRLRNLFGTGPMPMGGSGETLYRGWYDFDAPYAVTHCASLRFVADMGDDEKLMAVLPGGAAGRTFHPHQKNLIKGFMEGAVQYWWFSDAAIKAHAKNTLTLLP